MLKTLIACFRGPRLYRLHRPENGQASRDYKPNDLEKISDQVVRWVRFFKAFSYWTSPVILTILYRKDMFTTLDGIGWLVKFTGVIGFIYVFALGVRGLGRFTNQEYVAFLAVLQAARRAWTPLNRRLLSAYDFEFFAWPVDFRWDEASKGDTDKKSRVVIPRRSTSRGIAHQFKALPCHILSYIAIHTFGRRMIYPGATSMQHLMTQPLNQGRAKLVEEKNGKRAKLLTEDGNEIDTMFMDRRNMPAFPNGNILVVCFEGNAGFYEIGCTVTPMDAGFSVLGWNHPGFAGSTGVPFPSQEHNAADATMQYAINRLGFKPEDIALFAWSIGGYTASWTAMNYPDIKYMVLDATFDDIVPLAVKRMPQSWGNLVKLTVRKYMNLNIAEQICRYPGPLLLIRRTRDEIITTEEQGVLSANRGNDVLVKVLQYRYPKIIDDTTLPIVRALLAEEKHYQLAMLAEKGVDDDLCNSLIRSYVLEHSNSFPMQFGEDMASPTKIQIALFLATVHLHDYEATHCMPLPANYFREPWTVPL